VTINLAANTENSTDHSATTTVGPAIRSPRISAADVYTSADALLLAGHRPTIDRVRMQLGRGSPNTIQEHLDVWWSRLGSRLRDIPGREFPQLPERVAIALQGLWNTAIDCAQESIGDTLSNRDAAAAQRESDLSARELEISQREQSAEALAGTLQESLDLARQQLQAANQRADRLEVTLQVRESESAQLQARFEAMESQMADVRKRSEAAAMVHDAERAKLEARHEAAEARWLVEVDRAREALKEATKNQRQKEKELVLQINRLRTDRDELKSSLRGVRSELRAETALRTKIQKNLTIRAPAPRKGSEAARAHGARRP
jgi:hypothetical protein